MMQIGNWGRGSLAVVFLATMTCCLVVSCDDDSTSPTDGHVDNTDYSATAEFSFRLAVGNRSALHLYGITGTVEITGVSAIDSVHLWGERRVESESEEDAAEHLPDLQVIVTEGTEQITVRTEQPDQTDGRNYEVDYHVDIPISWRVFVDQVTGNISITAVDGSTEVNSITGNVTVEDSNADLGIDLITGNINLSDVQGNVDADLITGNINAEIILPDEGSCKLDVITGQINLSIPQSTSASFSARVTTGSINLTDLVLNDPYITPTIVTGTLGTGNGSIDLQIITGDIRVTGE